MHFQFYCDGTVIPHWPQERMQIVVLCKSCRRYSFKLVIVAPITGLLSPCADLERCASSTIPWGAVSIRHLGGIGMTVGPYRFIWGLVRLLDVWIWNPLTIVTLLWGLPPLRPNLTV